METTQIRQKTHIAEKYQNHGELKDFIYALPTSFDQCGELLWNGRNKIKMFTLGGTEKIVVKRFKSLSFFQKIGYCFQKHKAYNAFHNGERMIHLGIHTPTPIAYIIQYKNLFISDAFYICESCDMAPIEDLLYRDDWNEPLATDFACFVATLHQKGILHHDLNDTNVRFIKQQDGSYDFSLIDINRMSFYDSIDKIPMKERIENLTRFTGRYDLFSYVIKIYAHEFKLNEKWVRQAIEQKKRHDRNWYRRKRILHTLARIAGAKKV